MHVSLDSHWNAAWGFATNVPRRSSSGAANSARQVEGGWVCYPHGGQVASWLPYEGIHSYLQGI